MPNFDMTRVRMLGAGAAFVGAAVSTELAWLHARALSALGVICGGATPHCGWCVSAVALGLIGAAALAAEWRAQSLAAVALAARPADRT